MGLFDKFVESIVAVIAGLLGFGFLVAGGQQAAYDGGIGGTIMVVIGIVLLVFAAKAG
ncbi:hypothetical protein [Halorubrum salinum]|uniref:hypothetical protein n=1 Tax=Halorubrum salinum TaxID=767517 RepID=UPI00211352AB|nr:hypothetical protein [Halorubrum salinum]